jgi:ankyrin repeat protein
MNYFNLLAQTDTKPLTVYFKEHGANQEIEGQSLLYWAVYHNNVKAVQLLTACGAHLNHVDHLGRTALLIACFFGFIEIADYLLKLGADPAGCKDRAQNGWDGHVQNEILSLLKKYEKKLKRSCKSCAPIFIIDYSSP